MDSETKLDDARTSSLWHKYWRVPGFLGIFATVVVFFLIVPLFTKSFVAHIVLQGCFTLLIISTIYTLCKDKLLLYLGIALIIPFISFNVVSMFYDSIFFLCIAYLFYIFFIVLTDTILLRSVLKASVIDTNLIFGAIMVYFFTGILWGNLYFLVNIVYPHSFNGIPHIELDHSSLAAASVNHFDILYYSFTVLSTLGLGDITPVLHLARSLTILEAAFGQLFVATVIAKLVSVWHPDKKDEV